MLVPEIGQFVLDQRVLEWGYLYYIKRDILVELTQKIQVQIELEFICMLVEVTEIIAPPLFLED